MDKHVTNRSGGVNVESQIRMIRGIKAILDRDLAAIYGVETKILNKAVSRHRKRFPPDFAFRITAQEFTDLRFQNGTSNEGRGGRESSVACREMGEKTP